MSKHARLLLVIETNGKDQGEMNHTIKGFINNVLKGIVIPDFKNLSENDLHKITNVGWQWENEDTYPQIPSVREQTVIKEGDAEEK